MILITKNKICVCTKHTEGLPFLKLPVVQWTFRTVAIRLWNLVISSTLWYITVKIQPLPLSRAPIVSSMTDMVSVLPGPGGGRPHPRSPPRCRPGRHYCSPPALAPEPRDWHRPRPTAARGASGQPWRPWASKITDDWETLKFEGQRGPRGGGSPVLPVRARPRILLCVCMRGSGVCNFNEDNTRLPTSYIVYPLPVSPLLPPGARMVTRGRGDSVCSPGPFRGIRALVQMCRCRARGVFLWGPQGPTLTWLSRLLNR